MVSELGGVCIVFVFNVLCGLVLFGYETLKTWEKGPSLKRLVFGSGWDNTLEFCDAAGELLPDNFETVYLYDTLLNWQSFKEDVGLLLPPPNTHYEWNHLKQMYKLSGLPRFRRIQDMNPVLLIVWKDGTLYLQHKDKSFQVLR